MTALKSRVVAPNELLSSYIVLVAIVIHGSIIASDRRRVYRTTIVIAAFHRALSGAANSRAERATSKEMTRSFQSFRNFRAITYIYKNLLAPSSNNGTDGRYSRLHFDSTSREEERQTTLGDGESERSPRSGF